MTHFKNLCLAIAFSPRLEALLFETTRLKQLLNARLVLVHVGNTSDAEKVMLAEIMKRAGLHEQEIVIRWEQGDPSERILAVCREENVDLLIAGALKKENLMQSYLGSIARKILRRADCSVLTLLDPQTDPKPFKIIVVNAEDSPFVDYALAVTCELGKAESANWIHIVREIKLYGLTMSSTVEANEAEYEDRRQLMVSSEIEKAEKILADIPHEGLRINYKILSGKSGFELAKFAVNKKADLLVVGAPAHKLSFFDRVFPHDLEYIFADLPCNLLIVNPGKSNG